MTFDDVGKERLQKILARAGYGSRRACEDLIVAGRVTINNQTVSLLGVRADPFRDTINVDGERIHLPKPAYWILNKSEGMSFNDSEAEKALQNLVKGEFGRLFTAGRLDRFARGLMLITNDGRVANLLTHPRYRVPKVYRMTVRGALTTNDARNIERALYYAMNSGRFEPIQIGKRVGGKTQFELTVYEGLPQGMRDICLKFGHGVKQVERTRLGPMELGQAPTGGIRKLNADEVKRLLEYADDAENGRLSYEKPLIDPAKFKRDDTATGFRRKKTGTRGTSSVGQKKTSARLKTKGSGKPTGDRKPRGERAESDRPRSPRSDKPRGERSGSDRPRSPRSEKPRGERSGSDRPRSPRSDKPRGERSGSDRPRSPRSDKPRGERSGSDRPRSPRSDKPRGERSGSDRPRSPRSGSDRARSGSGPKRSGGSSRPDSRGPKRSGGKPGGSGRRPGKK